MTERPGTGCSEVLIVDVLEITRPDDWHLHLRDGAVLADALRHSAGAFARAIVMPNLRPPVRAAQDAAAYRSRILAARPPGSDFVPLMTLYLTDLTSPDDIHRARQSDVVAAKLYPAGATTNSEAGVTDLDRIEPALTAMADLGMPLLVHGEVTAPEVDVFDREKRFLDDVLGPLVARHPRLRVVMEHVTTREGVEFVRSGAPNLAATITAHHLLLGRNALFEGGLNPHHYCLPVLKREHHREALLEAATGGDPGFFLGTDSAPHEVGAKECPRACAGIFTAHAALGLYAEAFESVGALDRLEAFASFHGPDFYRLPRNSGHIRLERKVWRVPEVYPFGTGRVVPLRAGGSVAWQLVEP